MAKHPLGFVLIFSLIASLGLVSFVSCLVAEAKRTKRDDLKLDGNLCFLPESDAFGLGVVALICLSLAQIIGNVLVCANYWFRGKARKANKPILTAILLAISWISFGIAVILISVATSMSRRQPYGQGWLDGECYIVRGGVYISSGVLSLAATFTLLGAAATVTTTDQVEQGQKVHNAL
ncbi:hypothetical protein COLO4_16745 [Corchorus olitorius]|uniref:Uncharacterized protein n=1 Tax=Corchorus olitorius TaxID=93759 RepID=A0A1R3JFS7_9ROSI|nr:hypothetical protein COLO4_16745 [Corchorus olitorius]